MFTSYIQAKRDYLPHAPFATSTQFVSSITIRYQGFANFHANRELLLYRAKRVVCNFVTLLQESNP